MNYNEVPLWYFDIKSERDWALRSIIFLSFKTKPIGKGRLILNDSPMRVPWGQHVPLMRFDGHCHNKPKT